MKRKICFLLCLVMLLSTALTACGGGTTGGSAANEVVFAVPSEPTTMDALTAGERITYLPVHAIHDTLLYENADGTLSGNLVESWEMNDEDPRGRQVPRRSGHDRG